MAASAPLTQTDDVTEIVDLTKALVGLRVATLDKREIPEEVIFRKFEFWDTQPVHKMGDRPEKVKNEPFDPNIVIDNVRKEPYALPPPFVWDSLDLDDPAIMNELVEMLNENFFDDNESPARFDFTPEFLKWSMCPPGKNKEWFCAIRAAKSKKLVGFVGATPLGLKIYDKRVRAAHVNFLCVHKKLRGKRMVPLLGREIARRVQLTGVFQAIWSSPLIVPRPISIFEYYIRFINIQKIIDLGFDSELEEMPPKSAARKYRITGSELLSERWKPLTESTKDGARALLEAHLRYYKLYDEMLFEKKAFSHRFSPNDDVVRTYVVEVNGKVTDLMTYTMLTRKLEKGRTKKYSTFRNGYMGYAVNTTMTLRDLLMDALVFAKKDGIDIFVISDIMNYYIEVNLATMGFRRSEWLQMYYLWNWRCPVIVAEDIGIML